MTNPPSNPPEPKLRYLNRLEIPETFSDSLHSVTFDGRDVRIEFCINRYDPPAPPQPPTGDQVTACRLVLQLPAALALLSNLKQLEGSLLASGQLKPIQVTTTDRIN